MKKWMMSILMLIVCVLIISQNAQADVIWEPEDSFYKRHMEECEYHNRNYTTNGPNGEVIVYMSPETNIKVKTLENGTSVNVYYIYEAEDGILWGLYDNYQENITGWMPMDYLSLIYDYISFEEEFGHKFKSETGQLPQEYTGEDILVWSYPGSESATTMVARDPMEYSQVFVDEEGHKWGYIGYFYGWRNIWFCIDDPTAEFDTLYPDGAPARGTNQEDITPSAEKIVPKGSMLKTIIIVGVLVVSVILLTWKLLQKLKLSEKC